jgi:hypothetical protein
MERRTDTRIEKLHRQIFKRARVGMPRPGAAYIPDPVKWSRLNQIQKMQHIAKANNYIDYMVENAKYLNYPELTEFYSSRPNLYRNIVVPPGFDSVQDYFGAIFLDRFGY